MECPQCHATLTRVERVCPYCKHEIPLELLPDEAIVSAFESAPVAPARGMGAKAAAGLKEIPWRTVILVAFPLIALLAAGIAWLLSSRFMPGYNLSRGDALYAEGQYEEALQAYERTVKAEPDSAEAHEKAGWARYQMGQPAEAAEDFYAAVYHNPDAAGTHLGLGRAYYDEGEYEDAAEEFELALELGMVNAEPYAYLGLSYARMEACHLAHESLTAARALDPSLTIVDEGFLLCADQ